jgi:hypothetical protein
MFGEDETDNCLFAEIQGEEKREAIRQFLVRPPISKACFFGLSGAFYSNSIERFRVQQTRLLPATLSGTRLFS